MTDANCVSLFPAENASTSTHAEGGGKERGGVGKGRRGKGGGEGTEGRGREEKGRGKVKEKRGATRFEGVAAPRETHE